MNHLLVLALLATTAFACTPGSGGGPPADLGPGACTDEHACKSGICTEPGGFLGCGACRPPPATSCTKDGDCAGLGDANVICSSDPHDCFCSSVSVCRAGCAVNVDCDAKSQICGTDHLCAGKPCGGDVDCPSDFACTASHCQRRTCTGTAQCGVNYCVKGNCYPTPGSCGFPPP